MTSSNAFGQLAVTISNQRSIRGVINPRSLRKKAKNSTYHIG